MRIGLKFCCYVFAFVMLSPLICAELTARRLARRDVFFNAHAQLLSLIPGKMGWYFRNVYYRFVLNRCPLDCAFLFGTVFTHSEAEVGRNVWTGINTVIGRAIIGDWTMVSEGVHLISGKHQHGTSSSDIPFQLQPGTFDTIHIGRNCWIGANAVVMRDVGDNCVVGAGAVVTQCFPANKIIAGNPARIVGEIPASQVGSVGDVATAANVSS